MDDALLDPFLKLLAGLSTPAAVRAAERDGDTTALWAALSDSGYLDALVPEDRGGAGLAPGDIAALVLTCGEHLVAAPVAETIVARAILAREGNEDLPDCPLMLWPRSAEGHLRSPVAPVFCSGARALTQTGHRLELIDVLADARDGFALLPASLAPQPAGPAFDAGNADLLIWAAAIASAYAAGAMRRVLALSIDHVNNRAQFGRPLAKFQAIQHHLAVMAEQVAVACTAATVALSSNALVLNPWRVAVAKTVVNQATADVCALAHAVHGAIGISEEHDLQLYTRRIKRWQLSFGSQGYWTRRVASPWLDGGEGNSIDRIRRLNAD